MQFKKYNIILIIIGVWIALVALLIGGLNLLINSNALDKIFANQIGLKYEASNLKTNFDLKFRLNITADTVKFYDTEKKNCYAVANNVDIVVNPFLFLVNRIDIRKLNSENVTVKIKRDEKGSIDILRDLKIDFSQNKNLVLAKFNSDVNNLEFIFEDDYVIKSKTNLHLNNSVVRFSRRKNNFTLKEEGTIETSINNQEAKKANLALNILSKPKANEYKFNVNLDNINLYLLSDIAKKYISGDIQSLNGIMSLNMNMDNTHKLNLTIKNPSIKLKNSKIINPYKEVNVNGDFEFDKDKISVNDFEIRSNELFINTKGEILKPFSKNPKTELSSEIKNTQINNLIYIIPDNAIFYRPQGIPNFKKSNFHALAEGKVNLKLFPLDLTGSVKLLNIHIPNYPKPSHQNDATLFFMKDKMRVYTRVYTPDNEYVTVDGVSNLDDSLYGKYTIKSTNKIDLKFAQMYLVPIQQIIGFNIGPVPIMDIEGTGNIDIKTQGTIKDAQIFGYFNANNASAVIHGLDAKLTNGDCRLIFDNRNLIFKEIKGSLDGANFLLTGIGNTKGEVNLDVNIKNAYLTKLFKTFTNSVLTKEYSKSFRGISASSGIVNSKINLQGKITDYEKEDFLNNLALSGNFEFKNNKIITNNRLIIKNITGIFNFNQEKGQNGALEFFVNNSKFSTFFDTTASLDKIAKGKKFDMNVSLNSQKCEFADIVEELKNSKILSEKYKNFIDDISDINFFAKISLNSVISASLDKISLNDIKTKGYVVGLNSSKNKNISFEKGLIRIDNNNVIFDNFKALFFDGAVFAKGSSNSDLKISLKDINLEKFDKLLPKTKLQNAIIKSGDILIKKDTLKLSAINIDYNKMPVIINMLTKIKTKDNSFEADFSTIVNETTADCVINPYLTYPIKVKGEVGLKGRFWGNLQNYSIDFTTSIPKEADISYYGANIGDTAQLREISGKINVNHDTLSLNNLKLVKYIKNQNSKLNQLPVISLNGKISQKDNAIYYNNFKILTTSPVNVRVLNLIFKKSILKKGNFDCNVNINGNIQSPKVIGKVDLQDLDIPLYDTQINNIKINFTPNFIDADIQAKSKESDIHSMLRAVNSLELPYIVNKLTINSNRLDIDEILRNIPSQNSKTDILKKQEFILKPQDIIVKDGNFNFDSVSFENINAQNLKGNFAYKDNVFDLKNIVFDIAQGKVSAKGNYSLDSTKLNLKAEMKNCDANLLAKDFLNISGQIFGNMTGNIDLTAKNLNTPEGIKNVESKVDFNIDNGKMPKLGSLEYLLRAGNVLRNGILGLSINNLIQVLTPYKTGEFDKISGSLNVSEGEVKNLEIMSKGKNLSMYLFGTYSILENFADIEIYGRLSQNISNTLGAVGNASIKQFISSFSRKQNPEENEHIKEYLDKIPLVDSSDQGGYFSAKVIGDINKDNYIKKFSWEN